MDRGRNSVEIAVILFTCFLINKNEVYLNRGNHEDHVMNLRYCPSKIGYMLVSKIFKSFDNYCKLFIFIFTKYLQIDVPAICAVFKNSSQFIYHKISKEYLYPRQQVTKYDVFDPSVSPVFGQGNSS